MNIKTGKVVFETTKLDVTDPCYDKNGWCRIKVEIVPGEYIYKAYIREVANSGKRVVRLSIISVSKKGRARVGKRVGSIGVDAGLAGFFENKPNYSFGQWQKICDTLNGTLDVCEAKKSNLMRCNGVFSASGLGDGYYGVYELLDWKDNRCGYTIFFI